MISMSRKDLIALYKQFQAHPSSQGVHIRKNFFGKLVFEFIEPPKKETQKKK